MGLCTGSCRGAAPRGKSSSPSRCEVAAEAPVPLGAGGKASASRSRHGRGVVGTSQPKTLLAGLAFGFSNTVSVPVRLPLNTDGAVPPACSVGRQKHGQGPARKAPWGSPRAQELWTRKGPGGPSPSPRTHVGMPTTPGTLTAFPHDLVGLGLDLLLSGQVPTGPLQVLLLHGWALLPHGSFRGISLGEPRASS